MVDVSAKAPTERIAVAEGAVVMQPANPRSRPCWQCQERRRAGHCAHRRHHGGQAHARTDPALPSAADHQDRVDIDPEHSLPGFRVSATVKVTGQTGVEMEALTAVSIACLTIYDMVKAVERGMRIEGIRLLEKSGGKSGHLPGGSLNHGTRCRSPKPCSACWPMPRRCRRRRCRSTTRSAACSPKTAGAAHPAAGDVSAMDGYAVRAADVADAPVTLTVIGEVAAGHPFEGTVGPARPRASLPAASCRPAPTPS